MSLWNAVCSVLLCSLWEKEQLRNSLGSFFSHRSHRFYRIFLRTVLNSQNASGIQISQSVKTIVDTNKGQHEAYIHSIGESRWSLPFPPGEGTGEGPSPFWNPVCSVHLCFSVRKRTLETRGESFSLTENTECYCYAWRWGLGKMSVHTMIKKYYIKFRETPSKYEYNVSCDSIYNLHEIRMLWVTFETMPFLLQEGRH